jgi:hypothetical protein
MASTSSKFDPQAPDKSSRGPGAQQRSASPLSESYAGMAEVPLDLDGYEIDLLALIGRANDISREYQQKTLEPQVAVAYRAWNNQHAQNSKYLGVDFKGRSRLFVPKTRTAVRKNMATAAAALFANDEVVNVSAAYEDDPTQQATAAAMRANLALRLNSGTGTKVGIPWYQISMGACHDSQLQGVCISKQFWEYEEVPTREVDIVPTPLTDDETGKAVFTVDPETGTQMPVMWDKEVPRMRVVKDRPMSLLIPVENCDIDPAAPWYSPAQGGRWLSVRYAMGLSDARAMLDSPGKNGESNWLPVSDAVLLKGRIDDERAGLRRARENNNSDRYEDGRGTNELDIIWVQENFLRISGIDYHWWSIGRYAFLSKVRETQEAYPEFGGERPYVMGLAGIDPHRVFPMSPVHSWQPLQLELNDITNLRQDTLKRSIAPLTIVRRGSNVDRQALMRRGQPNAVVELDKLDDIEFQSTPGPTGASYTEASVQNSQFDELAGVFSTSSVQSSRQLNETVGGMRMMSGAANAVSEFDLRVWIETWVEPVVRQFMHLLRSYESDETVLAVAGAKARVMEKFNYLPTLSDFQATEMLLNVNAGVGAMDPMQQLAKFKMGLEVLLPMIPGMQAQGIKPKYEEFINEVMGKVGQKDGRRFFEFGEPVEPQPPPEVMLKLKEIEQRNAEAQLRAKTEAEKTASGERVRLAEIRSKEKVAAAGNLTDIEEENIRARSHLAGKAVDVELEREGREFEDQRADKDNEHAHMREAHSAEREDQRSERAADREDNRTERSAEREDQRADKERAARREETADSQKARINEIFAGAAAKGASEKGKPSGGKGNGAGSKTGGGQSGSGKSQSAAGGARGGAAGEASGKASLSELKAVLSRLDEIARSASATQETVSSLAAHMNAPAEVLYGKDGRPSGIRKGSQTTEIKYDGERIAGAVPQSGPRGPRTPPIEKTPGAEAVAPIGAEG